MGLRVSMSGLASAVADTGCVGVIASVGLGKFEDSPGKQQEDINNEALKREIRKAKSKTNGIIGINIMVALANYENLVKISIDEGADIIISGAGLPLNLPGYLNGRDVKLIPIVSSLKAFKIIYRKWQRDFNKIPDAVIVEGVKAGGHIGYRLDDIINHRTQTLEEIITEVVEFSSSLDKPVPVIAAGGIYDGKHMARFLKLGANGVQMATRFVCTDECDVHENFKKAYIDCKKEDIIIIDSPVGLPGRVIHNDFTERIMSGETIPFKCSFRCLRTCDPKTVPYCIAKVLADAAEGKMEDSFVFAGANAHRCDEIIPVKKLVERIIEEYQGAVVKPVSVR
jgi:NAD(P)H-dependent flavin oxidoreductase YrpB (nitropropane dioxygenase family)